MTAPWLSAAWFEAAAPALDGIAGPPTLTGDFVIEVTGGPDGDVSAHAVFAAGRLMDSGPGPVPDPDVTLTVSDADARAVVSGGLDPSVAFMQGRMKVAGAMGPLLDLLALCGTDEARARRARVAELTER